MLGDTNIPLSSLQEAQSRKSNSLPKGRCSGPSQSPDVWVPANQGFRAGRLCGAARTL